VLIIDVDMSEVTGEANQIIYYLPNVDNWGIYEDPLTGDKWDLQQYLNNRVVLEMALTWNLWNGGK
jgi:hypothetical protein